jgi:hypothetical protein
MGEVAMSEAYEASHIKRTRATKSEVEARRSDLYDIVADQYPMTVRQVFYQATVKGVVEKTEAGYTKVPQADLCIGAGGRRMTAKSRWLEAIKYADELALHLHPVMGKAA